MRRVVTTKVETEKQTDVNTQTKRHRPNREDSLNKGKKCQANNLDEGRLRRLTLKLMDGWMDRCMHTWMHGQTSR